MSFQVVLSDLDGTLLNSKHDFSHFTKKVVQEVKKQNKEFIIATGRHHIDVQGLLKKLGIKTTIITSNGARIHDEKGNLLFKENIKEEVAKEILQSFDYEKYPNLRVNVYKDDKWYTSKPISKRLEEFHKTTVFHSEHKDLSQLDSYEGIIKIFFFSENSSGLPNSNLAEDRKNLYEIESSILSKHAQGLVITAPSANTIEINSSLATKGQAMKKVLNSKNISLSEAIAFGDGFNDLDMLQEAGKALIMGNAHYTLKEALPDLEVIETCDEDAVAKYVVFSVLLKK